MNDTAIKVTGVHKNFKLPHQKAGSIKSMFTNVFSLGNHTYETQHALRDISFEIKQGEFFGIVGRNGSGKSTLLKILAGIYQPTKGDVQVNGRVVPFIELGVGFNGELTGRENLFLNGALLGFSQKEVEARYDDIVAFAELERFMDQKLKNYSSGMQVRLAFSVATRLAESDILLIDEVLAVGDANFQRKCFNYFRDLKKQKKTVIFVSHDMNAVREYCDRAILIEQSKMITQGVSEKVASAYTRMFTEELHASDSDSSDTKWGDKAITYQKVKIAETVLSDQKHLEVQAVARANQDIEDPIFGFSVTNSAGTTILGTNTKIKRQKLGTIKKGQTVTLDWKIPNLFTDGTYYVNVAAVHADGVEVCEWWDGAKTFKVVNEESTPYVVGPRIQVKVEKEGS
ncbi:MAG TPA: ABC transporter ATP-binding protein [Verrucomicrobiae bacterium]|nr:ABC transporter ATP-binding protein [Verrucomicrobiae bacterium]